MPSAKCGFIDVAGGASGAVLLNSNGPTILVDIGFDPDFKVGDENSPIPGITAVRALIDTGAEESCIDSLLANQLNLPVVDRRHVCGSAGRHEVNIHLAQVRFPALGFIQYGIFAGVHLDEGGQSHHALIGRTFLQHFTLTYEGRSGAVTLSSD